ncbi:hypothetical protein N7540_003252 [Penicillium herquei]|nr:hypothetical protein N7540_003252 [Penicillium herquei]
MVSPKAEETPMASRQRAREDHERIEKCIYWLMDNGCNLFNSNIPERDSKKRLPAGSEEGPEEGPKEVSQFRGTVLGLAILFASYEITSHLISQGANIHTREVRPAKCSGMRLGDKATPLHIAAMFWNLEGIHALFDHRGDVSLASLVSISDSYGRLPLHWAMCGMVDRRKEKDNADYLISRMLTTIKTLLDANPETVNSRDQDGSTVFHDAVYKCIEYREILEAVKLPLLARPSLDTINSRNHKDITAIGEAIRSFKMCGGTLKEVTSSIVTLIENGANARLCDKEGRNFLHRICMHSLDEPITPTLDQLLNYVDVNDTDHDVRTLLHYLVDSVEQIDALRHLITRGADVTKSDRHGDTPLHELIKGQIVRKRRHDKGIAARDEAIQVLINAGASLDLPNEAGRTPREIVSIT